MLLLIFWMLLNVKITLFFPTLSDVFVFHWKVGALANKEKCASGKYTTGGECCEQCPPGEGVVKPCGAAQTVCAPCLDSK